MQHQFAQQSAAALNQKKPAEPTYYNPEENRYPKWLYASGGREKLVQSEEGAALLLADGWREEQVRESAADTIAAGDEIELAKPGPMLSDELAELERLREEHPALQAKHEALDGAHRDALQQLSGQAAQFDKSWGELKARYDDLEARHNDLVAEAEGLRAAKGELQARHNGLLADHDQLKRSASQAALAPAPANPEPAIDNKPAKLNKK